MKTKHSYGTRAGRTPIGARFELRPYSLQWLAQGDVGPISIPLRGHAPIDEIYDELTTVGHLTDETRRLYVAH